MARAVSRRNPGLDAPETPQGFRICLSWRHKSPKTDVFQTRRHGIVQKDIVYIRTIADYEAVCLERPERALRNGTCRFEKDRCIGATISTSADSGCAMRDDGLVFPPCIRSESPTPILDRLNTGETP
jgi:hypothetical protein